LDWKHLGMTQLSTWFLPRKIKTKTSLVNEIEITLPWQRFYIRFNGLERKSIKSPSWGKMLSMDNNKTSREKKAGFKWKSYASGVKNHKSGMPLKGNLIVEWKV